MLYLLFDFFQFKSQFQIQSKHDHGVKSHRCSQCDYASSECNICSSMLHEEYTVKIKSFEVKSHKCNQCEYIADKSSNLIWAMSILNKEKPFE